MIYHIKHFPLMSFWAVVVFSSLTFLRKKCSVFFTSKIKVIAGYFPVPELTYKW